MPRRPFNHPALLLAAALLLTPLAGWGQTVADAQQARMWAATAHYMYHDDPDLKSIVGSLDSTVHDNSLQAFSRGLYEAMAIEKRKRGHSNLQGFHKLFESLQQQQLNAIELSSSIIKQLGNKSERKKDAARMERLKELDNKLSKLAADQNASVSPTTTAIAATTATPAPPTPADTPAPTGKVSQLPAPLPTPWLQWLALGLAGVSLLGLLALWSKVSKLAERVGRHRKDLDVMRETSHAPASPVPVAQIRQEVERQLAAHSQQAPPPVPLAATVPAAEAPPLPSAPRLRQQYINEAPFNGIFRSPTDHPQPFSIFVIDSSEEQPEQGTFTVTGNQGSHIRNHRSVLEPVCDYVGSYPLGSETRLVVEQPGQVRRTADGSWELTQRARVRFEA